MSFRNVACSPSYVTSRHCRLFFKIITNTNPHTNINTNTNTNTNVIEHVGGSPSCETSHLTSASYL